MSTFVLKRGYELQLPTRFTDIDRVEMEYLDGGTSASVVQEYLKNLTRDGAKAMMTKFIATYGVPAAKGLTVAKIGGVAFFTLYGSVFSALMVGAYAIYQWQKDPTLFSYASLSANSHRYCCQGMAVGTH